MNRSILLVVLGLIAFSSAHAAEPSVCTSMCSSEKQQCTSRAAKLTELDDRPSVEEVNSMRQAGGVGQIVSESARAADRMAAQRRNKERVDVCNASYKRCSSACVPSATALVEQAAPAKQAD